MTLFNILISTVLKEKYININDSFSNTQSIPDTFNKIQEKYGTPFDISYVKNIISTSEHNETLEDSANTIAYYFSFYNCRNKIRQNIPTKIISTNKFHFLDGNLSNIFLSNQQKSGFLRFFCDLQKKYHAIHKFIHIWRFKRASIQIDYDLYLNPIETSKNVITLLQNGKKYMFTAGNLINILEAALSNAPNFFVEPLVCKNPYNNVPFSKSTLYNIYFFINSSTFIMPTLFRNYFMCNFDLGRFRDDNEVIIRDVAISKYVYNTNWKQLEYAALNVLSRNEWFDIDIDFPGEKLVNIMRPYLYLYYINRYSCDTSKITTAYDQLQRKLYRLYRYNPKFGRKILTRTYDEKGKRYFKTTFNDDHASFHQTSNNDSFMKSHIDVIEMSINQSDSESEEMETEQVHVPEYNPRNVVNVELSNDSSDESSDGSETTENQDDANSDISDIIIENSD